MSVTSYRIYCEECSNETVIRERDLDSSDWKVNSKYKNSGLCPACNPSIEPDEGSEYARCHEEIQFEDLDSIGEAGAGNLREKGIVTRQDVQNASDKEILDTSWVGEAGLESIRQAVR